MTLMPDKLEKKLRYTFKNKDLLYEALRHSSFVNEYPADKLPNNERLEFLGDAVLNLVISHILMNTYPEMNEGELSHARANLVNTITLATIARESNLGIHIQLGKGEIQTNGRDKNSILADTFEAVTAAVYLDGGFEAIFRIIKALFDFSLQKRLFTDSEHDYKSRLQEYLQELRHPVPNYKVISEIGPDHDKTFQVKIIACEITATGAGKSKKSAEQNAAKQVLAQLTTPKNDSK